MVKFLWLAIKRRVKLVSSGKNVPEIEQNVDRP